MASPKQLLATARDKRPALDHLVRAFQRFTADAGNRQAAAVTYFGFLSFFPVLALAAALLSLFLGPDSIDAIIRQVDEYAPGLAGQLELRKILGSSTIAGVAGLAGLAGLLYSGLGWVDALREAIRAVFHHNVKAGNLVVKKAKDVLVLAGLGLTILLSVAISSLSGTFSGFALELVGLGDSTVASIVSRVLGLVLGLGTSLLLFLFLFWRLPKVPSPVKRIFKGALLAAVLFEILKRVGAFYIERTTSNPVYGIFGVIVGLLVWINIVSRMLLLSAAWTVTAPYDSDVPPSGTSNPEMAEAAGVPVEFADNDPDDPPTLQEDGAPSPLAAALQGRTPSQDVPEGRDQASQDSEREASRAQGGGGAAAGSAAAHGAPAGSAAAHGAPAGSAAGHGSSSGSTGSGPGRVSTGRHEPGRSGDDGGQGSSARHRATGTALAESRPRNEVLVERAGNAAAGALGMAVVAVLLHVGRTLRELIRR